MARPDDPCAHRGQGLRLALRACVRTQAPGSSQVGVSSPLIAPPNGLGAQLRAAASRWLDRRAMFQCLTLPGVDWHALWLVSCSDGMDSSRNVLGIKVPTLP